MSRPRKLTPAQKREAAEMRDKIRILDQAKLTASADALRRKLRALTGGYDEEAKRYE